MRPDRPSRDAPRRTVSPVCEQPARCLVFRLQRGRYAIPLPAVSGFGDVGEVRRVPGAPPAVMGLVEWRGRLLTLIDLPQLLRDAPHADPPCMVRLAPPRDHIAFRVPAVVLVRDLEQEGEPARRLLDPAALLADLCARSVG